MTLVHDGSMMIHNGKKVGFPVWGNMFSVTCPTSQLKGKKTSDGRWPLLRHFKSEDVQSFINGHKWTKASFHSFINDHHLWTIIEITSHHEPTLFSESTKAFTMFLRNHPATLAGIMVHDCFMQLIILCFLSCVFLDTLMQATRCARAVSSGEFTSH